MKNLLATIFLSILFVVPSYAQSYTEIVWTQIQNSFESASSDGYAMKNYIIGAIGEDEDNTWTFYLDSSKEYLIRGFCDEDCNDLDLYLRDNSGEELDSDIEDDDFPLMYFSPTSSNRYQIEISMYSCSVEPCYFGLAIFEK
ncbi:MAG: hypothetical protein JJ966_00340 [Balneolaceae bacterium]|nr:hypothetical protein [Balneolaceae bacterium]